MAKFLNVKLKVDFTKKIINPTNKQLAEINTLPKKAFDYFVKITPIDKGNARRNTRLVNNEIIADYPYAKRLDEGYSRQAVNGMVEPTETYLRKEFKKIFRRKT